MSLLRMCLSRTRLPRARVTGALGWFAALLLSPALGACSTAGSATEAPVWYGENAPGQMTGQIAGQMAGLRAAPPVEVEDDGIEAQRPPPLHAQRPPDDPNEPYSRNYGSVPRA
jgi:hypothetical protein